MPERGGVGERVSGLVVTFVTKVLNLIFQFVSNSVSIGLILRLNGSHTTSQCVSYYNSMCLILRLNGSEILSQLVSNYVAMGLSTSHICLRFRPNWSLSTS